MSAEERHLHRLADSVLRRRARAQQEDNSLASVRAAEQGAIRSLLKAADYVYGRGDSRRLYPEHDSLGLHHRERMGYLEDEYYESQGSSVEGVNRDLCEKWVELFWLETATKVAACMGVEGIEALDLRTPEQELGMALFLPLLAAEGLPDHELKDRTISQLAVLRLKLGRSKSRLETVFSFLAAELYRRDPTFHASALADPCPEPVVGIGHLDYEISQWDVIDEHDRIAHADDFSWVIVGGTRYEFTSGNQRGCIEVLWNAWETSGRLDGSSVTEIEIGERIGSSAQNFRVDSTFRDGNPAFGSIIKRAGRGRYALHLNDTEEIRSESQ